MKKHNLKQKGKRALSMLLAVMMVLSCWVWIEPNQLIAEAANDVVKDHYLFAYFTGTSKEGQTIHLAVSEDGYNYTALRNNEPVIIPSKGVGNVRDPYIWYNEQDNYYYILATDLDFTDGGGTYSNNSQSFIIWRSKDLVNWYDETFIDVSKMAHLIGDTRNMSAVWAPQVLWDGSAYVVYFTLACNATSWFDIVYLKTTDLLDPNAYYEFDYILGNSTGNGVCDRYGVIDADIIHNPGDGLYYLFYKTECNSNELGTTNKGTSLKTIHYYVGDTPTGPFRNPGDTKWTDCGFSIFPNYTVSLEGCNSFFDNDGNLIMYADEFEHTNANGEAEAYFHIAKSNGYDFTSWSYPDVSQHNINSLSPRHGSVVKITEAEYNRLLNNSYNITSSSYPDTEVLKDHLVAQFFTTENVLWNNVIGQPNLASSTGITMVDDPSIGYYASFDSTNGGWAEVDFDSLFLKTNGLNYEDGFTITFSAMLQPNESTNNENNDRIYEIADVFGSRTGTEHYTHFSPGGGGNGSYLGNYNGPVDSGNDWLNDINRANRDDKCFHEYIISYATGNVMVYVDGQLVISRNRFTGVNLDDSWYKALGSNATMRIGKSGWDADPLFKGNIQNLCIYDCSMSYYDAQSMNDDYKENLGWVDEVNYTGITSVVPTFQNTNADRMNSLPNKAEHFSNILYTSNTVPNYDGNNMSADSAVYHYNGNDLYFALYYPETTVLLYDGVKDAIMPVSFGAYCQNSRPEKGFLNIYPTTGSGSTVDLGELEISQNWGGWYNNGDYYECIVSHADGYIGRNSTTSSWSHITDKKNYDCHWGAPLKVNGDKINFNGKYYKKFNLTWQVNGGVDGTYAADHSANMTSYNDIYVINFKPILDLRNTITEAMYNEVMNNSALCPELKQRYASAVYAIRTMDPTNYGFDAAPLTATKACAKAISEAIGTYEGVIAEIEREKSAGTYGHQCTELEEREATCAKNGLTTGSYCVLCGEIVKEQQVLAPLAHTFTDITENGVQYKQCSVCGVKIEYQASGVRYENLFSLNGWIDSLSYNNGNGVSGGATLSANSANGTITINNTNTGEAVTSTSGGTNRDGTWDCYCIPVKGNRTYVVEFTVSGVQGEIHVFKYDINGNLTGSYGDTPVSGTDGTFSKEFTVDATTAYIELRFDCNVQGTTTFSQIGVYSKESFDTFAKTTADARLGFYPGYSKELCYPNPSAGYSFGGWYTRSGIKIENVNQLNNPTTVVYGKWIKAGYNIVYDSIFSFSDWAKSSCNQLETQIIDGVRQVSTEGIVADASNGTITITNDVDANTYARTNYWVDNGNIHKMKLTQNTDYILEYTTSSNDGGKQNVCLYLTGGTAQYPETGALTRWDMGTQYVPFNSGDNTNLTLRFDNVQAGSTVTYSNIAVYKADFEEAAKTIENRQYMRYYPTEMGIGNVFEYTPTRPGYTFSTWKADTNGDNVGDFEMKGFDDTFVVNQNWHLFSEWEENTYTITYDANGGSGSGTTPSNKYTADVKLSDGTGFTKTNYVIAGWSTIPNATSAQYQLGQTVNRLSGENGGNIKLYAVWAEANINVTFDNLFDFSKFNISTGSLEINERTGTGFTITSTSGTDANTGWSEYIPVESGKTYILSAEASFEQVSGGYDIYIYTLDSNKAGETTATPDTSNGARREGDVYISLTGQTTNKTPYIRFTAGTGTAYVRIRFDANAVDNKLTVNNIRLYEDNGVSLSTANKTVGYGNEYGDLPTPTRKGYTFLGWKNDSNQWVNKTDKMASLTTVNLHSQWNEIIYTLNYSANGPDVDATANNKNVGYTGTITLPAALSWDDGVFMGWSFDQFADPYGSDFKAAGSTVKVSEVPETAIDASGDVPVIRIHAVWKLNSSVVVNDTVIADFGQPVTISPYQMSDSTAFLYHVDPRFSTYNVEFSNGSKEYSGSYGTFSVNDDGYTITYTPTSVMQGIDTAEIKATLKYNDTGTKQVFTSTIKVAPASNMLYEEDDFVTYGNGQTYKAWTKTGSSSYTEKLYDKNTGIYNDQNLIEDTPEEVHGYNGKYEGNYDFADGSYSKVTVTADNTGTTVKENMSDAATFTFTGTGFDLISACGTNTGIQLIKVKDSSTDKLVDSYIIDTYLSDTSYMTTGADGSLLHQVPILTYRTENHGTYTVEVTAAYLSMAQALKHTGTAAVSYASAPVVAGNGVEISTTTSTASSELINELEEMGVDMGDNVELIWMDDNSILNGGTGATEIATTVPKNGLLSGYAQQYLSSSVTSLANYIDGFRIYNPLEGGDPIYDSETEQNNTYYNIVEEIGKTYSNNFKIIESGAVDFDFTSEAFKAFDYNGFRTNGGPSGEIYLKPNQAIAFTFTASTDGTPSKVMLGMRALTGSTQASVCTTDNISSPYSVPVNSATEMYYDVSEAGTVKNGVITIAIANTGSKVLAVNNLKLVDGALNKSGTGETPAGSNDVIGGGSSVPEAVLPVTPVTPVAPDSEQNETGNIGNAPETDVDTENTVPENDADVEDNTEEDADNSVTTMFPGIPAPVASFLELLLELISKLLGSFGF